MMVNEQNKQNRVEQNPVNSKGALSSNDLTQRETGEDFCNFLFVSRAMRKDADLACTRCTPKQILSDVRKKLTKKEQPSEAQVPWFSFPWLIRYALLAVALFGFCWLMFVRENKSAPDHPDSTHAGLSYAEMTRVHSPSRTASVYRTQAAFSSSFSPLESSFQGNFFCVYDGEMSYKLSPPGMIPGKVNQIWVSQSFQKDALIKYLKVLCADLNVEEYQMTPCGSALAFSAKMKERQAAVLAKQLYAWGMNDLSSHAPSPKQNFFVGNGFKPVHYRLVILMPANETILNPSELSPVLSSTVM